MFSTTDELITNPIYGFGGNLLKDEHGNYISDDIGEDDLLTELQEYGIDYYIVWVLPDNRGIPAFLSHYKEITNSELMGGSGSLPGLRMYSLKEKV